MPTDRKPGALYRFVSSLRSLVSECERSAEVLHLAAEKLADPTLKPMLDAYAVNRDVAVARLSQTLAEFGATPAISSRWGGTPQSGEGDQAIVHACNRSEAKMLKRFARLFELEMPETVKAALLRCFEEIRNVGSVLQGWMVPPPQLQVA